MRKFWSEEENDILRKLWNKDGIEFEDVEKVLIGRTGSAIKNRAYRMGLPLWCGNKREIDYDHLKKLMEVVEG